MHFQLSAFNFQLEPSPFSHLPSYIYLNPSPFSLIFLPTFEFMEQLTLTTPALLFSAISLIMLAYTNRFLAYAAVVRSLHDKYLEKKDDMLIRQIRNLRQRLYLTRAMQIFGISSLLLCVLTMFLIYIELHVVAVWVFGLALIFLIVSSSSIIPIFIWFKSKLIRCD